MGQEQQEILWKPDTDSSEDDLTRRPKLRYKLCGLCSGVLTSPEIFQVRWDTPLGRGVTLCGGTSQETQCSLRAMLLDCSKRCRSLASEQDRDKWPDYESMNGVLTLSSTGVTGDEALLYIRPGPQNGLGPSSSVSLRFRVQAYLDDPAAEIIKSRPFLPDLGSGEAFEQMKQWIKVCEQSHLDCGNNSSATTCLPSRVIDVQSLRLHQSINGEVGEYAALTYCWGCPTVSGLLVGANLQAMEEDIQLELLPQTVKDAISVTQGLGLKYIWIDAYCIIQDSVDDKNRELARMAEIYSQAYVTLSASTAATVHDGFLFERKPRPRSHYQPYQYPRLLVPFGLPNAEGVTGTAILQESNCEEMPKRDPIMLRSWTFQERLLSRRILIFGAHELYWQCNGAQRSCSAFDQTNEFIRPPRLFKGASPEDKESLWEWEDVIEEYTRRDITREEDRLLAFAGVASRFAETQGGNDVYLAGLWMSKIRDQLLWKTKWSNASRPTVFVAPSWSWASLKCFPDGVTFSGGGFNDYGKEHPYVEIIKCETSLKIPNIPFGQVTDGRIRLRGPLRPAMKPRSTAISEDEQDTLSTSNPFTFASESFGGYEVESDTASFVPEFNMNVRWDVGSEPHDRYLVFYLRVVAKYGLVLTVVQPGVFQRIGLHISASKEIADDIFKGSRVTDIEII